MNLFKKNVAQLGEYWVWDISVKMRYAFVRNAKKCISASRQ